jgi:putative photosynthetic complex assembly protein
MHTTPGGSGHADVPRGVLIAIAVLLSASVAGTAAVRLSGTPVRAADAPALAARALRFVDLPDGGIAVIDAADGRTVETVHGEAGFLRGALRALARERRLRGLGAELPFELIARADGRLTLADPATGERLDLEAFGPQHAGTFGRLLTVHRGRPARP